MVVAGFEPLDIMEAILMVVRQLNDGRAQVENQYKRIVPQAGNAAALRAMDEVFVLRPSFEWRGLGSIPHSAFAIKPEFAAFDAERVFDVPGSASPIRAARSAARFLRACCSRTSAGSSEPSATPNVRSVR